MSKVSTDTLLTRGVKNTIPDKDGLRKLIESGRKLNVYLGIDATSTRIHIGHAVPLRKLKAFASLGHNVTFLIGDFTTLIGDTSDKKSERPILSKKEIEKNFKTYKKQASKILDFSKVNVKYNSEWLKNLNFEDIVKLTRHFSVGDFVNRKLIRERLSSNKRVRLDEVLYPVMQGYDSYHLDTDIQIGAADQTFNMQAGRTLNKNLREKESFILVVDYLMGVDGRKMSKSWGNAIWIEDSPNQMYGKVMSLDDKLIPQYLDLATSLEKGEVKKLVEKSKDDPMGVKKSLARQIVKEFHSANLSDSAQKHFEETFQEDMPKYDRKWKLKRDSTLLDLVAEFVTSKSEAKRLIKQKGVDIDSSAADDFNQKLKGGEKVKIGKKIFVEVVK
jgi:tyrosyl-tRNA synthetase